MALVQTRTCDKTITKRGNTTVCGQEVGEPTSMRLDNDNREIDLCDEHKSELVATLEPFTSVGRKVTPRTGPPVQPGRRGHRVSTTSTRSDLKEIRTWALENGYKVAPMGRISREIQDAYDAAHAAA
jgi:hypothetical protein